MTDTPSYDYDAVVIGSGVTGGWAAKGLCENGLRVLMIDRGHNVVHGQYQHENTPPWEMPFHGKKPLRTYAERYPINRKLYGMNEYNRHYYLPDFDEPYQTAENTDFWWARPDCVGGKSLLWSRQVYRWNREDFLANKKDGHGVPWPIGYDELAPWYSYVEKFIGVSGEKLGLPQLPDGEFMPPMELNIVEKILKKRIESAFPERVLTIGRSANITRAIPEQGRSPCQYRNQCSRGCSFGAYFSTQSSTLPAAQKTGNLTVLPRSLVASLHYDATSKRVTGVNIINADDKSRSFVTGRLVFLCASTIASVKILLQSQSDAFPHGLGNQHDNVGRYIMDHVYGSEIKGMFPELGDKITYGRRPNVSYIPRFRNWPSQDPEVEFLRGYGFQIVTRRGPRHVAKGFGVTLKHDMATLPPWQIAFAGFGECLPYRDNRVALSGMQTDNYGLPILRFDVSFRHNERLQRLDMLEQGEAMLLKAGCRTTKKEFGELVPGRAVHEMGGAVMGDDPKLSVVNKWNQVHGVPNVFVTDGACFPSQSCVNPSISFMAMTARAANHAAALMAEGEI